MVKRKTIGIIQLIIGILILLIGIGGLIYSLDLYGELKEEMLYDLRPFSDIEDSISALNYTNDTKIILLMENINLMQNRILFDQQKVILLILFSSLAIILSLLFISRGLLNSSKQKIRTEENYNLRW